jgi:type II secretory pathway pseudopilin PulG
MKRVVVLALTGAAFLTASTAFAGQSETQIRQTDRVMQAKRAEQAAQAQRGMAGPAGPEGKVGPGGKKTPVTSLTGHPTTRTFNP